MTKKAEVVFENNLFQLSRNSTGYWIWSKLLKHNIAMRAKTEHDAYVEAIKMLSTSKHRLLDERNRLSKALDKIRALVEGWD